MQKFESYKQQPFYALIGGLAILISSAMAFINFYEFIIVAVPGNASGYPFGSEGPVPYYYKSRELYSMINLFWGLGFVITLAFTLEGWIEKRKISLILTFLMSLVLTALVYVHGQTGVN